MKWMKIKNKFKKYGLFRFLLVLFRKGIMQPLGLLKLYSSYYISKRNNFPLGSKKWLIATEEKYGGRITNKKHNGGDRMSFWWHNYAPEYEKAIKKFINKKSPITLIEIGIFKGTGMAIWSDLLPKGKIIGLDHNLKNFNEHCRYLKSKGAFQNNNIKVYEFDQYEKKIDVLNNILNKNKVDMVIDDGNHKTDAILNTMKNIIPFLQKDFVYIVEDNDTVHRDIRKLYPKFTVCNNGELTVITPEIN